jgi:hypothetical protein
MWYAPFPGGLRLAPESVYLQEHMRLAEEGVPLKKKGIFL